MHPITAPVSITIRQPAAGSADTAVLLREWWGNDFANAAAMVCDGRKIWLAYENDMPCGVLVLENTGEISVWYVSPEARGQGAAYLLLDQAIAAAEHPYLWVSLYNEQAQRCLNRYGFVPDGGNRFGKDGETPEVRYTADSGIRYTQPVRLDVPFIDQRVKYPTGCESVSAVMALRYAGLPITVEDWIDNHLPRGAAPYVKNGVLTGANPWKAFPGDPYSSDGWGCFVPVIEAAAGTALQETGLRIKPLYGLPLETLCRLYLARGIPVMLWATLDMAEGRSCTSWRMDDGSGTYTWTEPMHCLLMTGFDDMYIYCNDPMRGKDMAYLRDKVQKAYHTMHTQAAVVLPERVPMTYAHRAGAVLYTVRDGELRYLLVRESLGHIGFPTGHLEAGETVQDAALREIREETGLRAELSAGFRQELIYSLRNGNKWKRVTYFAARYDPAEEPQQTGEVAQVMELSYADAIEALTYRNTKNLLEQADSWIRAGRI